ncbi:glycosyltransferase family 4 protein [Sphingomonas profundi]|uniref:glycosyltransferase family 4 protein n=1 Tax=Alterirhizorhabdus profundi TaxID=2681549 RepID=UPI0012E8A3D6|nr:glycosyltransferase family 1 protein [Sphingomonas profundi]
MIFAFKTRKSAGVRVTRAVHRLIAEGNEARAAGRWGDAVAAYGEALRRAPELAHIQLQQGHMLKEAARLDEADAAYAAAARLRPDDAEPVLHRARLARQRDRPRTAAAHLAEYLRGHRDDAAATAELRDLIEPVGTIPAERIGALIDDPDAMRLLGAGEGRAGPGSAAAPARPPVFDITDLISHFGSQRLPNGIERVQIEVLAAALALHGDDAIGICCFVPARQDWIGIAPAVFHDVARLATAGTDTADAAWQAARARLIFHIAFADPFAMPPRAVLLNLGTSWWVRDYFLFVRNQKARHGIAYVPAVYDFIPILAAEHCVPGLAEDFIGWTLGALAHADAFLPISRATRDDLLHVADVIGAPLDGTPIEVVPLDADFRRGEASLPATALAAWGLEGVPFALIVSTIESRKNHVLAFDAWAVLLRRHGAAMPRLVCVGRDGWLNDHVFARLEADPLLKAAVTIIHRVSDAELALLYRQSGFTVFPSLYEGWGLPVTESLSHGRVPVVADNSSLPEAGAGFALMFESGSVESLVAAVEQVAFDADWRRSREAAIAAGFHPRSWRAVAAQILSAVARLPLDHDATRPHEVERGLYYPLRLPRAQRIWPGLGSGEVFRTGKGWLWLETNGCRTRPAGGELRMRVAGDPAGPLRLYLRLRGLANGDCRFAIRLQGLTIHEDAIAQGAEGWFACDLPAAADEDLAFVIVGDAQESLLMPIGGSARQCTASLMVLGFVLCDRDAAAGNARVAELLRRNATAEIDAYRAR